MFMGSFQLGYFLQKPGWYLYKDKLKKTQDINWTHFNMLDVKKDHRPNKKIIEIATSSFNYTKGKWYWKKNTMKIKSENASSL